MPKPGFARLHTKLALADLRRFALLFRDIEEMLASRRVTVSYEAIACGAASWDLTMPEGCDKQAAIGPMLACGRNVQSASAEHFITCGEPSIKTVRLWIFRSRPGAIVQP
jgi:hypothetical protein